MLKEKKLYALIIGINHYKAVRNLNSAVSDAEKIHDYLDSFCKRIKIQYNSKLLLNEKATRFNIIDNFKYFLSQARATDLAVFYFSGHGSQELTPDALKTVEDDTLMETIVCQDSRQKNIPDIADKELRYLIHKVATKTSHFLCLFDCCHSGNNTKTSQIARRYNTKGGLRQWKNFVFSEKYPTIQSFIDKGGITKALPEGDHIQIAACNSDELALENATGGIFTTALLHILQSTNGNISYFALKNRIVYTLQRQKYKQIPQFLVRGNSLNIYSSFLNIEDNHSIKGNLFWENTKKAWIVDLGLIHGLSPQLMTKKYALLIVDDKYFTMTKATINNIAFNYAELNIDSIQLFNPKEYYTVLIPTISLVSISLYTNLLQNIIEALSMHLNFKTLGLKWESNESQSSYTLIQRENTIFITNPVDHKPIVEGIPISKFNNILIYFNYISKWIYIRRLITKSRNTYNPIQLNISINNKHYDIVNHIVEIPLKSSSNHKKSNVVSIRLTNKGHKSMYFCLIGLSHQFGIYTELLGEQFVKIAPKDSRKIELNFNIPMYVKKDQWAYSPTILKVIATKQKTDISFFQQQELPEPYSKNTQINFTEIKKRWVSIIGGEKKNDFLIKEWFEYSIELRILNPFID